MSDSKCQRLDAISDRDQMAEKPPSEHAKEWMKRPAYYGVLGYLRHKNIDTGEEIGRGQGMLEKISEESKGITES